MKIRVNGEVLESSGANLEELLLQLKIDKNRCVVEHNGEVVFRDSLAKATLKEGDSLEIVRFVGGG